MVIFTYYDTCMSDGFEGFPKLKIQSKKYSERIINLYKTICHNFVYVYVFVQFTLGSSDLYLSNVRFWKAVQSEDQFFKSLQAEFLFYFESYHSLYRMLGVCYSIQLNRT
jgi:hypothetical protein